MKNSSISTTKKIRIEKNKIKFSEIDGGCSCIYTNVMRSIKDLFLKGLYCHLLSLPEDWIINPKQLSQEFNCGIKKIYKGLADLILIGLVTRVELREKGRFVDYEYYVHLSPNGQNGSSVSPNGQKPLSGEPNGQNGRTYKEDKLPYKEENKKKEANATSTPKPYNKEYQEYKGRIKTDQTLGLITSDHEILSYEEWIISTKNTP